MERGGPAWDSCFGLSEDGGPPSAETPLAGDAVQPGEGVSWQAEQVAKAREAGDVNRDVLGDEADVVIEEGRLAVGARERLRTAAGDVRGVEPSSRGSCRKRTGHRVMVATSILERWLKPRDERRDA